MENNEVIGIKEKKNKTNKKQGNKEKFKSHNNNKYSNNKEQSGPTTIQIDNSSHRYGLPICDDPKKPDANSNSIIENQNSPSLTDMDIRLDPIDIICPFCKMKITTEVEESFNCLTCCCLSFLCCCLILGILYDGCKCDSSCCSCCCCNCKCKGCYDGEHRCPNCKNLIFSYNSCYRIICPRCPKIYQDN